jgi:hypothetical protein
MARPLTPRVSSFEKFKPGKFNRLFANKTSLYLHSFLYGLLADISGPTSIVVVIAKIIIVGEIAVVIFKPTLGLLLEKNVQIDSGTQNVPL